MKKLPASLRKYIRREKARIRREILDFEKQKEEIKKIYQKVLNQYQSQKRERKISLKISQKEKTLTKEKCE